MKDCRACKRNKQESEFHKCLSAADGLQAACKSCVAAYHKRKYYVDLEKSREYGRKINRKRRLSSPEKIRDQQAKYRQDPVVRERARQRAAEYRKKNPNYNKDYRAQFPEVVENTRLKATYGITLQEKKELFERQGGCCAVCKEAKKLDVDHDHQTGKVRGLLCRHCNTSLGLLKESPIVIRGLLEYIGEAGT